MLIIIGILLGAFISIRLVKARKEKSLKNKEERELKKFRLETLGEDIEIESQEHAERIANRLLPEAVKTAIDLDAILCADINALLDEENNSEIGRRRLIREIVSYVEAICNSYQKIGAIAYAIYGEDQLKPHYSQKQLKAIRGKKLSTSERIKTLTAVGHKVFFNGESNSNFNGEGWDKALKLISKRHELTHPSKSEHLRIDENEWQDLLEGARYLMSESYEPNRLMTEKLVSEKE